MTDFDSMARVLNFDTTHDFRSVAWSVLREEFTSEELEISNKVCVRVLELMKLYVLIESAGDK